MWWFIFSRTAALVWEEWGRRKKKEKVSVVFWSTVVIYLIGLATFFANRSPFSELGKTDLAHLLLAVQYAAIVLFAGPFMFAGAVLAVYFFINVLWCIIFPLAGIQRLLDEENKVAGRMFIPFDGGDK